MSEKNPKISVLNKMTSANSKAIHECVVPQNSTANLCRRHGFCEVNTAEVHCESRQVPCPHCENMAKNFLYLESLIRYNINKIEKCNLCDSALKYLQYVNRNIMQVFGSYESILSAAKDFEKNHPLPILQTKGSLTKVSPSSRMIAGSVKAPKRSKSHLKVLKSTKSTHKSLKRLEKTASAKDKMSSKLSAKLASKLASTRGKGLRVKHKKSVRSIRMKRSLSQVVRSASQYVLRKRKSKRPKKAPIVRNELINWRLLKDNLPKRKGISRMI